MINKITNNFYYINNEHKTLNTVIKTFIIDITDNKTSLYYHLIAESITEKIKNYNKQEFEILKQLNYDISFKTSVKESKTKLIIKLSVSFIELNFLKENKEILDFTFNIFNSLLLDEKELNITINNLLETYIQLKDNKDLYNAELISDMIYKEDEKYLDYEKVIAQLKDVNISQILKQFKNLNNNQSYYVVEASKESLELIKPYIPEGKEELKLSLISLYNISFKEEISENITGENQLSIAISFQNKDLKIEDDLKLNLLNILFGGSSFSLLFKNIREKEKLCYSVYSKVEENYGLTVYTGVAKDKKDYVIEKIKKEFEKIKNKKCDKEFELSKQKYISVLKQRQKKLYFQTELLERSLINQMKLQNVDELIKEINSIEYKELIEFSQNFKVIKISIIN